MGATDGKTEGCADGTAVRSHEGVQVGIQDGTCVDGIVVGSSVGTKDGASDGSAGWIIVRIDEGFAVGVQEGSADFLLGSDD